MYNNAFSVPNQILYGIIFIAAAGAYSLANPKTLNGCTNCYIQCENQYTSSGYSFIRVENNTAYFYSNKNQIQQITKLTPGFNCEYRKFS